MSMTDPIADYLTRIRNACMARHSKVDIPASNLLKKVTQILQDEGYIRSFTTVEDSKQGTIRIYLKYDKDKKPIIEGISRASRPGLRQYVGVKKLPRVLNGLGIAVMTTPKGVMTEKKAKQASVGGEVLCYIW
ncbi:30S ribosomal protein S8 [candidate division KSB1 bacterium]|nr:30S ribosomal protein S8 [candidate division KSB1 bacterium]